MKRKTEHIPGIPRWAGKFTSYLEDRVRMSQLDETTKKAITRWIGDKNEEIQSILEKAGLPRRKPENSSEIALGGLYDLVLRISTRLKDEGIVPPAEKNLLSDPVLMQMPFFIRDAMDQCLGIPLAGDHLEEF